MMTIILPYIIIAVVLSVALVLVSALRGPTRYDRLLAANVFGTKTMILIALLALLFEEPMLIDIAIVYAMINFVTTLAVLKYTRDQNLGSVSS